MTADERRLRTQLVEAGRRMNATGLNQGKSGNLSARFGAGFIVTPTGIPYERLEPADLVSMEGDTPNGAHAPSSEWRLHRDVYASRPEVGAVVHTHSPYATTLACLRRAIPAFHYEVAFAGGRDIRCSPYATFGTQELSRLGLAALEGRRACLLANHGLVAIGRDLDEAFGLAEKVENLARLYWQALQVEEPAILDDAEMDRILEKFRDYGPPAGP